LNTAVARYALFITVDLRFSNGQGRRKLPVIGAFRPRTMCATINQNIRVFIRKTVQSRYDRIIQVRQISRR